MAMILEKNLSPYAIEIQGVCKKYGSRLALDEVHFAIPRASVFALLGHNGAGKSTLARILVGLTQADAGQVLYNGCPMKSDAQASRLIGFVSAELDLFADLTVYEHIRLACALYALDAGQGEEMIGQWGMKEYKNLLVRELSSGLAKKLALMLAIIHDPPLLILDEPFSGLDPLASFFLKTKIKEWQTLGKTILVTGHQLDLFDSLADGYAILAQGRLLIASDSREQTETRLSLEAIYLHHAQAQLEGV